METKEQIEALMRHNEQRKQSIKIEHDAGRMTANVWNERRRIICLNQKRLNDRMLDIDVARWRKMRDEEENQLGFF